MNAVLPPPPRSAVAHASFVVLEWFSAGHPFELRLFHGGRSRCWTLPKGPVLGPGDRHLAIETAPPAAAAPDGEACEWDSGGCEVRTWNEERMVFVLHGGKLRGCHGFIRYRPAGPRHWIFISMRRQPRPETHANPRRTAP